MKERIEFYSSRGDHGFMSNFARYPVRAFGRLYKTSEHLYQSMKFKGTRYEAQVRAAANPGLAADIGRDRRLPLREDWETVKDDVMRFAVLHKFLQHEALQEELLATGVATLVEHTANDSYWADGGDGSGKNMLGRILEEVRTVIRLQRAWALEESLTRPYISLQDPVTTYLNGLRNF